FGGRPEPRSPRMRPDARSVFPGVRTCVHEPTEVIAQLSLHSRHIDELLLRLPRHPDPGKQLVPTAVPEPSSHLHESVHLGTRTQEVGTNEVFDGQPSRQGPSPNHNERGMSIKLSKLRLRRVEKADMLPLLI